MRPAFFATTILALVLLVSNSVFACDCAALRPSERFENADVVFEGQLLGITRVSADSPFGVVYTFGPTRFLKGSPEGVVTIYGDGSDCDAQFRPGVAYRVYANNTQGRLSSTACSGNEIVSIKGVYKPKASTQTGAVWELWFVNVLKVVGIGVLLGSGVFLWRKKFG